MGARQNTEDSCTIHQSMAEEIKLIYASLHATGCGGNSIYFVICHGQPTVDMSLG
jgi:hypothetical protein